MILVSYILPALVYAKQGKPEEGKALLATASELETSADLQDRSAFAMVSAAVLRAEGRNADAMRLGELAFDAVSHLGAGESVQEGLIEAVEAALALGDTAGARRLIDRAMAQRAVDRTRYLTAHLQGFEARLAALAGHTDAAETGFKRAAASFRELGVPFGLAACLLEYAEWLTDERRADEVPALLREARGVFEELGAAPWLRRVAHAEHAAGIIPTTSRDGAEDGAAAEPAPATEPALRVQGIGD